MLDKGAQSSGHVAERSRNSRDEDQHFRQQDLKLCGGARKDSTFILLVASFSMDVPTLVHSAPTYHTQPLSTVLRPMAHSRSGWRHAHVSTYKQYSFPLLLGPIAINNVLVPLWPLPPLC